MKKLLLLVALVAGPVAAHAQVLGNGLTLEGLKQGFKAGADWDKETSVVLRGCKLEATRQKTSSAFSCEVAGAGFVDGIVDGRAVRDASVNFVAADRQAIFDFQRASKYLITATQGARVANAVGIVAEMMGEAVKAPNRPVVKNLGPVRYSMMLDKSIQPAGTWRLAAEAAPAS